MKPTQNTERTIQALDRAVAILRALAAQADGMPLTALATQVGLAPQTLQSLIRTLQVHGLVVQDGRGAPYRLGSGILTLAQAFIANDGLAAAARPAVAELAAATGEYVLLAEWRGQNLAAMVEVRRNQPLMVDHVQFAPDQIHSMATGKLLLAYLSPEALEPILPRLRFAATARNAVRNAQQLQRQLAEIRRSEQAICIDERADHVVALAVPVRDSSSSVRAALGIYLPAARYSSATGKALLSQMRATAKAIAHAWGSAD